MHGRITKPRINMKCSRNGVLHLTLLSLMLLITFSTLSCARPVKDSPIKTIIVPYQPSVVSGKPYQFPKATISETRQVLVPATMDVVPRFNLKKGDMALGSQKGEPLNFADGAYPVYYMPGNANGKFNGKISLLV